MHIFNLDAKESLHECVRMRRQSARRHDRQAEQSARRRHDVYLAFVGTVQLRSPRKGRLLAATQSSCKQPMPTKFLCRLHLLDCWPGMNLFVIIMVVVVVVVVVAVVVFISIPINLQLNSSQIGCRYIEDSLTPLRVVEYHGPPFSGEKGMHRKQSSVCRFNACDALPTPFTSADCLDNPEHAMEPSQMQESARVQWNRTRRTGLERLEQQGIKCLTWTVLRSLQEVSRFHPARMPLASTTAFAP